MQALQVQDKQEPIVKGTADDYQLIQDDMVTVEPVPVELKWNMTDEEFGEYGKAACEVIGSNIEFQDESLRRFLKRNDILVYSLENVGRLLKYKNNNQNCFFIFLIESDRNKEIKNDVTLSQLGGLLIHGGVFHGFMPLRVVKRINLLLKEFPELCCLISSSDSDKDDIEKFIVITFGKYRYSEVYVIDMWNEDESVIIRKEK